MRNFKRLFWDDAFVVFALGMLLATAIIWNSVSKYMYASLYLASGETRIPPPNFVSNTETYLRASLAIIFLFTSGLWSIKIAFLLFFRRLSEGVSGQRVLWWTAFAWTAATYFISIGTIQYNCLLPSFVVITEKCSLPAAVNFERITLCINCAMDVSTDLLSKINVLPKFTRYI